MRRGHPSLHLALLTLGQGSVAAPQDLTGNPSAGGRREGVEGGLGVTGGAAPIWAPVSGAACMGPGVNEDGMSCHPHPALRSLLARPLSGRNGPHQSERREGAWVAADNPSTHWLLDLRTHTYLGAQARTSGLRPDPRKALARRFLGCVPPRPNPPKESAARAERGARAGRGSKTLTADDPCPAVRPLLR